MKFLKKIRDNHAAGAIHAAGVGRSIHATHTAGETLLEAIIAISIFTLIVGPASALFTSSIRTVAMNRNDLIAASLADEGVEIMRNIRDSNLLKFSSKAEECWNTVPDHDTLTDALDPTDNCEDNNNKIGTVTSSDPENFVLTLDPESLDWNLVSRASDLDLASADNEAYNLRLDERGVSGSPDCRSTAPAPAPAPPAPCFNYTSVYFAPPATPPELADRGVESPFYRQVSVSYPAVADFPDGEIMSVSVLVQYRNGSSVRNIERGIILTNQPA